MNWPLLSWWLPGPPTEGCGQEHTSLTEPWELEGRREEQGQAQPSQAKLQAGSAHQQMSDRIVWATLTVSLGAHGTHVHTHSHDQNRGWETIA